MAPDNLIEFLKEDSRACLYWPFCATVTREGLKRACHSSVIKIKELEQTGELVFRKLLSISIWCKCCENAMISGPVVRLSIKHVNKKESASLLLIWWAKSQHYMLCRQKWKRTSAMDTSNKWTLECGPKCVHLLKDRLNKLTQNLEPISLLRGL